MWVNEHDALCGTLDPEDEVGVEPALFKKAYAVTRPKFRSRNSSVLLGSAFGLALQ